MKILLYVLLGQHTVEDRSSAIVGTAVSLGFTRQFRRDFRRHWRRWLQAIFQSSPSGLGLPTYGQISALVDPTPLKALVAGTIASAIEGAVFMRHLLVAGAIRGAICRRCCRLQCRLRCGSGTTFQALQKCYFRH